MADDWRVTVTPHDKGNVRRAAKSLREHEVTSDISDRLGRRVAVSVDGPHVFLYAGTEDAAREAGRVVREVLARHQMLADIALDRWQPLKQEWVDAGAPVPEAAELRRAEHQRLMDEETRQSLAHGQAGWEVRVELPSHREAVALAERLRAQGRPVIRRWRYLILGTRNEDEASELAQAIKREAPAAASVSTGMVPFAHYGPAQAGDVLFFPKF